MHRKKILLTIGCVLLAAVMLSAGSMAWLSKTQTTKDLYTALSDFDVKGTLFFGDKEYSGEYSGESGRESITVPVSLKKGGDNYIGSMRYVVNYTGVSPAYIRVRILEQWVDISTNEVQAVNFLGYHVVSTGLASQKSSSSKSGSTIPAAGSGTDDELAETGVWVDNRQNDYCYYYNVPVQPKQLAVSGGDSLTIGDGTVELTLIDQTALGESGGDFVADYADSNIRMELVIEVEAVQPNRYREFWGISTLPF